MTDVGSDTTGEQPGEYRIGKYTFRSRLIIGTGKYESFEQNLACVEASGAERVTVALRRVNFDAAKGPRLLDVISPERFTILPNTAGCYTVEDAVTTAQLGRRSRRARWVWEVPWRHFFAPLACKHVYAYVRR